MENNIQTIENIMDILFDQDISNNTKMDTLRNINEDMCLEIVNSLTSMYNFESTHILEKLLESISLVPVGLPIITRLQILECIYLEKPVLARELLFTVLKQIDYNDSDISLSIVINSWKHLFETEESNKHEINQDEPERFYIVNLFIKNILINSRIEISDRYNIIINMQREKTALPYYLEQFFLFWVTGKYDTNTIHIPSRFKILASQYILQHSSPELRNLVETICLEIATDTELDYNLRADSADLIIRLGNDTNKLIARDIIILLGRDNTGFKTIYSDKQNVHTREIDESIKDFIAKLTDITLDETQTIDDIQNILIHHKSGSDKKEYSSEDIDSIKSSILRIKIDNTLYNGSQTLSSIFLKIWKLVNEYKDDSKITLISRINEELIDMCNTCSSGHLSRLINILSGFTDTIKINFYDQIKANLFARLYTKIKNITIVGDVKYIPASNDTSNDTPNYISMTPEELELYQFNILDQLTISNGDHETKKDLIDFFRKHLSPIINELYSEFVPQYLTDNVFDEYIRRAIIEFEN